VPVYPHLLRVRDRGNFHPRHFQRHQAYSLEADALSSLLRGRIRSGAL